MIFAAIAAKSGIGLFEPTARIFVGVAEIIAAVLSQTLHTSFQPLAKKKQFGEMSGLEK